MPVIFGAPLTTWLIRIVGAILGYLLVTWLLPLLMNAVGFPIPGQIVTILAILVALVILFGSYWPRGGPVAP